MTTAYTSLLGLALPVTGELSGTWGDVVNNSITSLLDSAIAGTTTLSSDTDVTLTTTTGAANTSREAIILWTAGGTATRTITAPAQSKTYVVINKTSSTQSIKLVGAGPTTGVTIIAGESAVCAWNGVDFIKTSSTIANAAGSNTQVQFNSSGVLGGSANLTWDGTYLTAGSIKNSALTSTRVTFAGASGLLSDSASLTWDGTSLTASNYVSAGNITINTNKFTVVGSSGNTVIGGTATVNSLTSGRVTFAGTSGLLSDSANLTWNGTALSVTGTVAVTGALTATLDSTFSSTGALTISKGTTAQQPGSPVTGMMRYNSTTNQFEGYSGSSPAWKSIGGSALSNDTSTASNLYPVFAGATTGTAENLYTGNAYLLYKPSTGEFQSRVPVASNGIVVNSLTVATSYTIAAGYSGMSAGPITVASGAVVTVSSGSRWVVQ